MNQNEVMEKLREVEYSESLFSRVMHAKTVQELIDIPVKPEELLSYFRAAEELAKLEEESAFYGRMVAQKLRDAYPAKRRRRIFI